MVQCRGIWPVYVHERENSKKPVFRCSSEFRVFANPNSTSLKLYSLSGLGEFAEFHEIEDFVGFIFSEKKPGYMQVYEFGLQVLKSKGELSE